jgi:hypothetical protein
MIQQLDNGYYKVTNDEPLAKFVRKHFTRRAKQLMEIKFPIIGKHRKSILVPNGSYSPLMVTYCQFKAVINDFDDDIDSYFIDVQKT